MSFLNCFKCSKKDLIVDIIMFFCILFLFIILHSINVKGDCTSLNNAEWYVSFDSLNGNDDSGHGYNPTAYNNTFTGTDCKLGNCADFSGTQQYLEYSDFLDGWNNFTFAFWVKRDVDSGGYERVLAKTGNTDNDYDYIIQIENNDKIQNVMYNQLGVAQSTVDTNNIGIGGWNHYVVTWDGVNVRIFINGTLKTKAAKTLTTLYNDVTKWNFGRMYAGAYYYGFNGRIDEVWVKRTNLSLANIELLFNNGLGCNPYNGTAPDTTPPTITFTSQVPTNLTILNAMNIGVKINYTITDATNVNTSTVYMNMTVNNSNQYINGVKYPMVYNKKKYNINSGSNFYWFFDDNQIYNGIYLVNTSIQETKTHYSYTLNQANDWVKITFRNVSNQKQYSLIEGMTQNASATLCNLQMYYCNVSYVSGNPISSKNCALFFEGVNNNVYNHTHSGGLSKHKIYSLGISNGKVNGVGVTQTSQILIRGSNVCNHLLYYTNQSHRLGDTTYSNNNFITSNEFTLGTFDFHLHQLSANLSESINYNVYACDTLGNCGNSVKRYDKIERQNLNPSSPFITSPTASTYINSVPITITYTSCVSPVNLNINRYLIQYAYSGTSTYTTIVSNNYPSLTYLWAINAIGSGDYFIKVTCYDSINQSAFSTSEIFRITSMTDLLLTDINNTASNIYDLEYSFFNDAEDIVVEGENMLIWIILFVMLTLLGIFTIYKFLFILDGFVWFLLALILYNQTHISSSYETVYKTFILVFMVLISLGLIAIGFLQQLNIITSERKKKQDSYKY